jgi:hypothetical protein
VVEGVQAGIERGQRGIEVLQRLTELLALAVEALGDGAEGLVELRGSIWDSTETSCWKTVLIST